MNHVTILTTLADKAGVMVYDGDLLIYVAGFSSLQAATRAVSYVLDFVREYYEVQELTAKVYEVQS